MITPWYNSKQKKTAEPRDKTTQVKTITDDY